MHTGLSRRISASPWPEMTMHILLYTTLTNLPLRCIEIEEENIGRLGLNLPKEGNAATRVGKAECLAIGAPGGLKGKGSRLQGHR